MVKLSPSIFVGIFSLCSLCAVALPSHVAVHPRTVDVLTKAIHLLKKQLKIMTSDLNAFSQTNGTIQQALTIHNDATKVNETLINAAQEAVGPTVSGKEAGVIIKALHALEPLVVTALRAVVEKKSAFVGLPVANVAKVVQQDINYLEIGSQGLGKNILAQFPKNNTVEATTIFDNIRAAFAEANAAYAEV